MDEGFMAEVIGSVLDESGGGWSAIGLDIGEVHLTNEDGDKYLLIVTKVEAFPGEEDE